MVGLPVIPELGQIFGEVGLGRRVAGKYYVDQNGEVMGGNDLNPVNDIFYSGTGRMNSVPGFHTVSDPHTKENNPNPNFLSEYVFGSILVVFYFINKLYHILAYCRLEISPYSLFNRLYLSTSATK